MELTRQDATRLHVEMVGVNPSGLFECPSPEESRVPTESAIPGNRFLRVVKPRDLSLAAVGLSESVRCGRGARWTQRMEMECRTRQARAHGQLDRTDTLENTAKLSASHVDRFECSTQLRNCERSRLRLVHACCSRVTR